MPPEQSNPEIRLGPATPLTVWDRLEWWHKTSLAVIGVLVFTFGVGAGYQRVKTAVVLADTQHAIDDRQVDSIRAVQDDAGRLHVSMDDLHDEVRGMRIDLRYFDPRLRGGGLPTLPEETPRPTAAQDPSMGLAAPSPIAKPKGTP